MSRSHTRPQLPLKKRFLIKASKITGKESINKNGVLGVNILCTYNDKVPNKKLREEIKYIFCKYPQKWGKGRWTAKTLDDAKQMAKDYAKGVS